jgi:hypothetical protein
MFQRTIVPYLTCICINRKNFNDSDIGSMTDWATYSAASSTLGSMNGNWKLDIANYSNWLKTGPRLGNVFFNSNVLGFRRVYYELVFSSPGKMAVGPCAL